MPKYSNEFKIEVIKYCIEEHHGYSSTAKYFNLPQEGAVLKWERIYYEEGPQGLYLERRGRRKNMSSKPRKKKISKEN